MEQVDLFGNVVSKKAGMSKSDIESSVEHILKDVSLDVLVSYLTNKYEQIIEYYMLSNGANTCKKMSLLFNPHRLATTAKGSPYSIYDAIINKKGFLSSVARAMSVRFNSSNNKPNDLLYRAFQFGAIDGVKYVNEFPPKIARDLCIKYGVNVNSVVLDPCAGWGGRMIGVSTVCNKYIGFEPSTKTYNGLGKLLLFIRSMNPMFNAELYKIPYEDAHVERESVDFAITSPPYYDTENYSDETTNSLNRYNCFDSWCDGFFVPMIKKTMDALKEGKAFVLNIGSRIYPLNEVLMDNFSNEYAIKRHKDMLMQRFGGFGTTEREGETFYVLTKK